MAVTFTSNAMKVITLQGNGANYTIYNSSSDPFFSVPNRITLSLGNNITLNGNQKYYPAVKILTGGTLNMNDDSTITNAKGSGVWVNGGTFNMTGGGIKNNSGGGSDSGGDGGGVYINNSGTFVMSGGTISDNIANHDGGGICVENGTFNMIGGNITSNTGGDTNYSNTGRGGGVCISENGVFSMSDGTISDNTAQSLYYAYGAGVYVDGAGSFTMSGGNISGNTTTATNNTYGGGVFIFHDYPYERIGAFTKNGGTIDNTNYAVYGKVACINGYLSADTERNTTSGPSDNMDSSIAGAAGGWE
jgi:hypothetical protein